MSAGALVPASVLSPDGGEVEETIGWLLHRRGGVVWKYTEHVSQEPT